MKELIHPDFITSIADNAPIKVSKNFYFSEFFKSDTAEKLRIVNLPPLEDMFSVRCNIAHLVHYVLQPLRDFAGPIKITSGFRCASVNEAVYGVSNSYHLYGRAADIVPLENSLDFCHRWLSDRDIKHIVYKTFIHVQI